jgi:hypothetical protein
MKNIVKFDITHTEPIIIKHNGIVVTSEEVECILCTNQFTIEGNDFVVNDMTMYKMGSKEIIRNATNESGVWSLKYEYPVFSWLHKISQHGWLIKEDDE